MGMGLTSTSVMARYLQTENSKSVRGSPGHLDPYRHTTIGKYRSKFPREASCMPPQNSPSRLPKPFTVNRSRSTCQQVLEKAGAFQQKRLSISLLANPKNTGDYTFTPMGPAAIFLLITFSIHLVPKLWKKPPATDNGENGLRQLLPLKRERAGPKWADVRDCFGALGVVINGCKDRAPSIGLNLNRCSIRDDGKLVKDGSYRCHCSVARILQPK